MFKVQSSNYLNQNDTVFWLSGLREFPGEFPLAEWPRGIPLADVASGNSQGNSQGTSKTKVGVK